MFATLKKLVGLGVSGNKGIRRAERPRARLELEALDQRLLPSSVPNLTGLVMHFDNPHTGASLGSTLTIQSEQDKGGGRGTFVGIYQDSRDGVSTHVTGSITFKGIGPNPDYYGQWISKSWDDFGLTFSGSAEHVQFNAHTGNWTDTMDSVYGSGDLYVTRVSGNASDYTNPYSPSFVPFDYFGNEADSHQVNTPYSDYIWTERDAVWAANWSPLQ